MERFDAVVIGAGPAGSTAALLLAECGWSLLLVEGKQFPRRKVCGEYLSATNWPLFRQLGIYDEFLQQAGPAVTGTALFAGRMTAEAALPQAPNDRLERWGRALSREHLDVLLRNRAVARGAVLAQPARCERAERVGDELECTIDGGNHVPRTVRARVVIGAHGSWELGDLATQRRPAPAAPGDLLAFKAHFRDSDLPAGLMPLLSFAGGYGGMTHCDDGRVSLSCCIQRSRLRQLARGSGETAGDAVLQHILESCPVLQSVLEPALLDGPWLSVGPIQPGMRPSYRDGLFAIGNAAGEAHPVVAEGISMAMQSAWILCRHLAALEPTSIDEPARHAVGRRYSREWRRAFAPRLRAAAAIAAWAMRPTLVQAAGPIFRSFPNLLTLGARLSGKSTVVVTDGFSPAAAC